MLVSHITPKPDLFNLIEQRSIISKQIKGYEDEYQATSDLMIKNELLRILVYLLSQSIRVQEQIVKFYEKKNSRSANKRAQSKKHSLLAQICEIYPV